MNFGDNLKNIRKMKKISQEELSEKLGVSRQSISKWETGENYPSMNNIICLCDIFHCKMNDLVHEDFKDINSLDPEIKMRVTKLKQKEQKKMKILSKIIEIIAKIGMHGLRIAAVVVAVIAIMIPIVLSQVKYKDNEVTINGFSKTKITFVETSNDLTIKINDKKVHDVVDYNILKMIHNSLENNSMLKLNIYLTFCFVVLTIYLYILSIILSYIAKLFKNINKGETPFTLENVSYIKKTAYFMIVAIVLSTIGGITLDYIAESNSFELDSFDLIEIMFLFAMAYIFEYGVEIQKDSEGIMYDEKED